MATNVNFSNDFLTIVEEDNSIASNSFKSFDEDAGEGWLNSDICFGNDRNFSPAPTFLQNLLNSPRQESSFQANDNSSYLINFGLNYEESSSDWSKVVSSYQETSLSELENGGHCFSKNTPFWNSSFAEKPKCHNLTTKKLELYAGEDDQKSGLIGIKKPRIDTPSPFPTFKVRKEKLGDPITALQQLVSPFGKTDTATVLHEAIDYIKFLHVQVNVLSTPYMKSGASDHHQKEPEEAKQELRNLGLCLVPISSTFAAAIETMHGLWTTFGSTFK